MNVRHEFASTGLPTASGKVSNARPNASSAKFERQGPTEADRKITSEPWSSMQRLTKTNQTTLRSAGRSVLKNGLTEPTLLEMSGLPTYRDLTEGERSRPPILPRPEESCIYDIDMIYASYMTTIHLDAAAWL
jgi:hypothetical protein